MESPARFRYIVGPTYDWAFFLLPPALSLWLGIMLSGSDFAVAPIEVGGRETTGAGFLLGAVVHAHLVAVLLRSHGNPAIFRLYPVRFVAVPILLWIAVSSSAWLAITATVVAMFWDVWHSGAQTFGFARIYDRNAAMPPRLGRRLDFWLNQLLYAGPILAGVTLADHLEELRSYEHVGATFFAAIPARVQSHQRYLTWAVLAAGTLFVAYYVYAYWRFYRQGYRFSFAKVYLLGSTGLCSIYTWGFNTWGEAFFIMNLFHAVQYLALVWATEHRQLMRRFRLAHVRGGKLVAGAAFFATAGAYGVAAELLDPTLRTLWAVTIVVSLMHFWYDAFIWSVQKQQV